MNVRRWMPYLLIAGFYVALYASWNRVAAPMSNPARYRHTSEVQRLSAARSKLRMEQAKLNEMVLSNRVRAMLPRTPGYFVSRAVTDTTNTKEYIYRVLQRDMPKHPAAVVGVLAFARDFIPEHELPMGLEDLYLSGILDRTPYCVVAKRDQPGWLRRETTRLGGSILGPCAFWAKYGAPGPEVQAWLNQAGRQFAADQGRLGMRYEYADWTAMGRAYQSRIGVRACIAGMVKACEHAFFDPGRHEYDGYLPRIGPGEDRMLGDLARQYGVQRFTKFWKSTEPVDRAFQAAFGLSAGAWVKDWAQARYGRYDAGSRMSALTVALSLLTLGLFAGLAVLAATRRRI